MERVADDVRQLRRRFNQVQKDLAKFEKRFAKTTTAKASGTASAKRREK